MGPKALFLAAAAVGGLVAIAQPASADTIKFYMSTTECVSCGTPGSQPPSLSNADSILVTVTLVNSTTATWEFDKPTNAASFHGPLHFNVDVKGGGSITVTSVPNMGPVYIPGGQQDDAMGLMNVASGSQTISSSVVFTVLAVGFTWTDAADVLKLSTGCAVAYPQCFNASLGGSFAEQRAGYYAATPVPAALPLFVSGLGALGVVGWRRKRKLQAA